MVFLVRICQRVAIKIGFFMGHLFSLFIFVAYMFLKQIQSKEIPYLIFG